MNRSKLLIKLASEKMLAYVGENTSVKNIDESNEISCTDSEPFPNSSSEYIPSTSYCSETSTDLISSIEELNVSKSYIESKKLKQVQEKELKNTTLKTAICNVENYSNVEDCQNTEVDVQLDDSFINNLNYFPVTAERAHLFDITNTTLKTPICNVENYLNVDDCNITEVDVQLDDSFINNLNYLPVNVERAHAFDTTDCTLLETASKLDNNSNKIDENGRKMAIEHSTASQTVNYEEFYLKKPSARERPTICPLCYEDVRTHFPRHLFRYHMDNKQVLEIKNLPPRNKQRLDMISALRKQGYFCLKTEKNITNPVRTAKKVDAVYFTCVYCLGQYSKKLLYKHVKICKQKPENELNPGKNCLSKSQSFMATMSSKNQTFLNSARIKEEVFNIMRADEISFTAKSDALICLYGEFLIKKHKRMQISTVISNKMREMGRLLIILRTINKSIDSLFDAIKPEYFEDLVTATKQMSGYNPINRCYKSPSLALHMGTNLKIVCDIATKIVIENKTLPKIKWDDKNIKKQEIKDTKRLIEGHWCNEVSSVALKVLKERQWEKPDNLPLAEDIRLFQMYVNKLAMEAYDELIVNVNVKINYRILTECVLALTVMFNRKRIGDVQYLTINTYKKQQEGSNQEAFIESLTDVEKILTKKFKRVVTGGKGSKPVSILFSLEIQKYVELILQIRQDSEIVPVSNPYLFANPSSENKWMAGYHIIRKLAINCGAKKPSLLTSTKFRKHIATTLQLMSMDDNEMEQVATFMGHTKKTHQEFYRLPQDIYQTAKVAKVLLLLEKGKCKELKGRSLDEIEVDNEMDYSSESDIEIPTQEDVTSKNSEVECMDQPEHTIPDVKISKSSTKKEPSGRVRWSENEKGIVKQHFKSHIKNKITPKRHECDELLTKHPAVFVNKDWVRIKTFVYNAFRKK